MTPEEHLRIKALFLRADELPPAEREGFLAASGEPEAVLRDVRRLLRLADETPSDYLCASPARAQKATLARGRRLGPYEVLARIAIGGMGEVWKARDTRLGREVAVKVLPPELGRDAERRARFEREARTVAALSHPNILALYDFDWSGSMAYAVMELLEGETLRERLRGGALPVSEAVGCAIQIARALAAAHDKGIVHRDLKSENVFLSGGGHVKLLDFGIAVWHEAGREPPGRHARPPLLTHPGTLLGTPAYMAPEQARGLPADRRADVFALGCVLYEMLSGTRAFERETIAATLAAVLTEEPPALAGLDESCRPVLERIVRRCLAKDPTRRYASAREVGLALEAVRDGAASERSSPRPRFVNTGPARLMIAVLPFESLGPDPEQELFADGMTEEMITVLGHAGPERLGVIARTSAMQLKGTKATVEEIGRVLGVGYLIEGSVRRQADRVRIAAKLIQTKDQAQLWSDSFDGSLDDILGLQSDVARRIAGALSVELVPRFRSAGPWAPTDARAYDAYLSGRASFYKASEQGWRRSLDFYRRAVALDPDFALGHAALASGYTTLALWGTTPPADARAKANEAVSRARQLDPDLVEVHATLGLIRMFFEWDWEEAGREFRRAVALNPSDGEVYHWYGHYLFFTGRLEEAAESFAAAQQFDPLSPFHRSCLGGHCVALGQLDRAESLLRGALDLCPESPLAHHYLGWLAERRGRMDDAVASWEAAVRASDIPNLVGTLGYGYARAGRLGDALRIREELDRRARRGYVASLDRAKVLAGLGDHEAAFARLDEAYRHREAWLAALKIEPGFDPLRNDPRFAALLGRIGVGS